MGQLHAALVAVRDEAGRFLMIRRSARVAAPHRVCFPGGRIERAEAPRAAAAREMREELGVELADLAVCLEAFEPTRGVWLHGFSARLASPVLLPDPAEVSEVLWLRADAARRHPDALQPSTDLLLDALLGSGPRP